MRIGTLVKDIYTDEVYVITQLDNDDYVVVNHEFLVRKDQLEVICK